MVKNLSMEKLWIMMQKKKDVIPDGVFQSKTNIVQTELVLKYNRQIQLMEVPKKKIRFIWKSCTQNLAL